jgi:hypothetical protein
VSRRFPTGRRFGADEIFGDAMYQGCQQAGPLPIAMIEPRQMTGEGCLEPTAFACGMPLPFAQLRIRDNDDRPKGRPTVRQRPPRHA